MAVTRRELLIGGSALVIGRRVGSKPAVPGATATPVLPKPEHSRSVESYEVVVK